MPDGINHVTIIESSAPTVFKSEVDQQEYPMAKVQQAYRLYMLEDKGLGEIAKEVGVPLVIVEEWFLKARWVERKALYANQTILSLDAELRRKQASERVATVTKQIQMARRVAEKASEEAMRAGTSRNLKEATDAMAAAASMEARAVGLAEKTVQRDVGSAGDELQQGKMVWIGVGVVPKEPKVIDVASNEIRND